MSWVSIEEKKWLPRGACQRDFLPVDLSRVELHEAIEALNLLEVADYGPRGSCSLLFYPGCGCDVVYPLEFVRRLWPGIKSLSCIFVDEREQLSLIESVLQTLDISWAREGEIIAFFWNKILVRLSFVKADAFIFSEKLSGYDIYFERAFRIIKDGRDDYEVRVVNNLRQEGVIISDSGFTGFSSALTYHQVRPDLSVYNEMVIASKWQQG